MMIRLHIAFLFVLISIVSVAQNNDQPDTTKSGVTVEVEKPAPIDSSKITDMGVAVAPSSMRFRVKPGESKTEYVTITNDTYKAHKFKLSFSDVAMNRTGKINQVPIGESAAEHGLQKWITAAPNFIELAPGEKKKVAIVLDVPDEKDANKAGWCLLMIDQVNERKYIAPDDLNSENIAFGIIPTFGFGVYIYQNPPNVAISKVEIVNFTFNYDNENRYVHLLTKNVGDGIALCKSYVEITNLETGFNERLDLKQFNVLPTQEREFEFLLPGEIPKGKYSIMGVLDFGSTEELEAAEMEITVE